MKIDQIALHVPDPDKFIAAFPLPGDWVADRVVAEGSVTKYMGDIRNVAELRFWYGFGIEFEVLTYVDGPNWHQAADRHGTFLSHFGMHVDSVQDCDDLINRFGVLQWVTTVEHTNRILVAQERQYQYVILDTRELLGAELKLIEKIG